MEDTAFVWNEEETRFQKTSRPLMWADDDVSANRLTSVVNIVIGRAWAELLPVELQDSLYSIASTVYKETVSHTASKGDK